MKTRFVIFAFLALLAAACSQSSFNEGPEKAERYSGSERADKVSDQPWNLKLQPEPRFATGTVSWTNVPIPTAFLSYQAPTDTAIFGLALLNESLDTVATGQIKFVFHVDDEPSKMIALYISSNIFSETSLGPEFLLAFDPAELEAKEADISTCLANCANADHPFWCKAGCWAQHVVAPLVTASALLMAALGALGA